MPIAFRAAATPVTNATRTTTTVNMPAGVQAGDVVLIWVSCGGSTSVTPTAPGTVTAVTANFAYSDNSPAWTVNTRVWRYTVVGSGDPASFAFTHSSIASEAFAIAFSGVDNTTPIDVTPTTNGANNAGSTTATALGVTTTVAGVELVVYRGSWDGNAITPPSGFTERLDQPVTWVGTQNMAAAGATGNFVIPTGNGGSSPWACVLVPLRPAGASIPSGTVAETINLADASSGTKVTRGTSAEAINLADTAAGTRTSSGSVAETSDLADAAAGLVLRQGTSAESSALVDSAAGVRVAGGSAADQLALADTAAGIAPPGGGTAAETIAATDAAAGVFVPLGNTTEGISALDAAAGLAPTVGMNDGSASESLDLVDSVTGSRPAQGLAPETASLADSAIGLVARRGTIAEGLNLGDSASGRVSMAGIAHDSAGLTDAAAGSMPSRGSAVETIDIADVADSGTTPTFSIGGVEATLRIGADEVDKVYLGSTLLYDAAG